ncbi:MAG: pyrroline-5-carboxylate reductase [Acaryochloridaceae cyanobacterium SU_2_1]|nr:pyrroline-5-carboxylate reductase [Acaryochloridaceae cyanobacterium SU_2_1]
MQDSPDQLGIIGGGVMAESILSRLLSQGLYRSDQILVSDVSAERLQYLADHYQVRGVADNPLVAISSSILILAIKPQVFDQVAAQLRATTHAFPLVISILAGVSLARLETAFGDTPLVRVMPNTPAQVGAAMTAIALGKQAKVHHQEQVQQLFTAIGEVVTVPESLMDAVTGLSGSGPAFVAMVLEALADGGVAVGLPRSMAAQLALQTLLGTALLVRETGIHPAQLKDQVTSPGGTTIAGVAALEKAGLRGALMDAVQAAYQRSQQLGADR